MLRTPTTIRVALLLFVAFALQIDLLHAQAPAAPERAQKPAAAEEEAPKHRVLYAARNSATDLASAMTRFYQDVPREALSVTAEPMSNQLLISGHREQVAELIDFLNQLDRPPQTIAIDVWIVEFKSPADAKTLTFSGPAEKVQAQLAELQKAEKLAIANHIQLGGASNQAMHVQQGEARPMVRGMQTTAAGRVSSTSTVHMGTIVGVTARVTPNNEIMAEFDVSKTYAAPEQAAATAIGGKAEEPRYGGTLTMTCQTTVTMRDGHAITLSGMNSTSIGPEIRIVAAGKIVDREDK